MIKTIFKCVMCEGNVYPCIFSVKTTDKTVNVPLICPYGHKMVKWEKVSKESETISYDTDGNTIHRNVARKTKGVKKVQDDDRSLQAWSDIILGKEVSK